MGVGPQATRADRAVSGAGRALIIHASRLARHTAGLAEGAPFDALVLAWCYEPVQ